MRNLAAIEGSVALVQARQALRELQVKAQSLENLVGRLIKNGTVTVRVNDLQDTNTKNLADDMILQYDAPTQQYVATSAAALGGVDAETLDGIDSLGFVRTTPGAGEDQTVVQQPNTSLILQSSNQSFYYPIFEIDNATLKIGNTPLGAPTWPPTTPGDGEFLIASRRVTDPGVGGSTLNIISDTGAVTRIDQPFLQRQDAEPATDGTQGYIWIKTHATDPDSLWFLLEGAWQIVASG